MHTINKMSIPDGNVGTFASGWVPTSEAITAVLTSPAGLLPVWRRDCLEVGDDLCSPRRSRDLLHLVLFGTPNGYLLEVCSLMFTS